jgi:hypothetical protein
LETRIGISSCDPVLMPAPGRCFPLLAHCSTFPIKLKRAKRKLDFLDFYLLFFKPKQEVSAGRVDRNRSPAFNIP